MGCIQTLTSIVGLLNRLVKLWCGWLITTVTAIITIYAAILDKIMPALGCHHFEHWNMIWRLHCTCAESVKRVPAHYSWTEFVLKKLHIWGINVFRINNTLRITIFMSVSIIQWRKAFGFMIIQQIQHSWNIINCINITRLKENEAPFTGRH